MMKIRILLILGAVFAYTSINAQKPILIQEDSLKVGSNRYPAVSVLIPEVKYETTQKNWIKLQESGTKSKVVDDAGKMSIFGAISKKVFENPFNILSELIDQDTILKLTAAFELKKDVYVERSTGEADLAKAKTYLFDFAKEQYVSLANEQLKAEQNKLKDLEKELSSLERDQSGMEKDIRSSNKQISAEKDKIIVLNNKLTSLSAAIIEHNAEYITMESGEVKDEKAKYIKDLEKQKKKATKSVKKAENKISKAENKINHANRAIPKNDNFQERIRMLINDQEAVVQKFTDKLNRIKALK